MRSETIFLIFLFTIHITTIGVSAEADSNAPIRNLVFSEDLVLGNDSDQPEILIGNITSVDTNKSGQIFVSDITIPCIYKLTPDGELIEKLGQSGEGPGDLMFATTIAIDSNDRIFLSGVGGSVHIMDSDWNYGGGFERENSGQIARSIDVSKSGSICIAATNLVDQTTVDLYSGEYSLKKSFSRTFVNSDSEDWRIEAIYAYGFATFSPEEEIIYLQFAPYDLRKYTSSGEFLLSTTKGGEDFVPFPPSPDFSNESTRVSFPWGTSGVIALSDGRIITSSYRKSPNIEPKSLICLYDNQLNLIGSSVISGLQSVVGKDREDRVFIFHNDEGPTRLSRNTITVAD